MIGASLDVFEHPGVDVAASCPREPVAVRHAEMDVYHPVEECRRHWLNDRRVLGAVAGTNHDRTLRKLVVADPSFVDEAVKRLLNFVAAGVELVEEEALWSLAGDHRRRAERLLPSTICGTPRRSSGASWLPRRDTQGSPTLLHDRGFADTRCPPDEHRPNDSDVQQKVGKLLLRECDL